MGTKANPAPNDCYDRAEPDEPMFVLLARDKAAPETVRSWVRLRRKMGKADWRVDGEAIRCADAMEAWRRTNRPPDPPKPIGFPSSDRERAVFNVLTYGRGGYGAEEWARSFSSIADDTGLTRNDVRLAARSLARKGLARHCKGLFNDDGEVAGSGYGVTRDGMKLANAWRAALPMMIWDAP